MQVDHDSVATSTLDSSFVLVDPVNNQDPTLLASLAPYFHSVVNRDAHNSTWSFDRVQHLKQARQSRPDRKLFIDELFNLVQIDGPSVYPPSSAESFNQVLYQLLASSATLQAHCILFYLLLADNHHSATPSTTLPTAFCRDFLLPTGFVRSIEGFHALDQGAFRAAVSALTDPHLTPDFVSKTLAVLGSNLPDKLERASLVLSFVRLNKVSLESVQDATVVVEALCDHQRKYGVTEAWAMQLKRQSVEERKQLLQRILAGCFGDNPFGKPVPHHLQTLLVQPFTHEEDTTTDDFCIASASSASVNTTLAVDWRLSKYIAESRPLDAIRFWSRAKSIVQSSDDRDRLLKAVYATLDEVQRSTIALEAEELAPRQVNGTSDSDATVDIARPAWQAPPAPAPTGPPPRSLYALQVSKQPAPAAPAPTAANLPLSASPFLRRERPLVSSTDASVLGGVQKNVLRALKEGAGPASPIKNQNHLSTARPATPQQKQSQHHQQYRSDTPTSFLARGSPAPASPSKTAFGSPRVLFPTTLRSSAVVDQEGRSETSAALSKPTLSGFGSVRQPFASTAYGRAPGPSTTTAHDVDMESDSHEGEGQEVRSQDRTAADDQFAVRVAQDPAIAATIAAASVPSPSQRTSTTMTNTTRKKTAPQTSGKRRVVSDGTASSATQDKRRAVSVETEEGGGRDKPSDRKTTTTGKGSLPPGAFPGQVQDDDEEELDQGQGQGQGQNVVDSATATKSSRRTRTSARTSTSSTTTRGRRASSSTNTNKTTIHNDKTPARERSTRASSVQLDSEGESQQQQQQQQQNDVTTAHDQTPRIRRSSRLRTPAKDVSGDDVASTTTTTRSARKSKNGGSGTGSKLGAAAATSTRRATGGARMAIEEEEEEEQEGEEDE